MHRFAINKGPAPVNSAATMANKTGRNVLGDSSGIALQDGCEILDVNGIPVEIFIAGDGPAILFLQGGTWLSDEHAFVQTLASHGRVIAPVHPGFGASGDPGDMASPDDLAYFYRDLIDQLGLDHVTIAGASFGGWIAAEMATKSNENIAGLVLIDALGIRPGVPTDRTICDIFGTKDSELVKRLYKNPAGGADNLRAINDDSDLRRRLRARDGLAYYGWQPYMHSPRLQNRLHRIKSPALVLWGDSDGIVSPDYGRAYAQAIPGAQFEIIATAGHLPHVEHPATVAERIGSFARNATGIPASA
jgi:pimeloyl-ACP methyl ester carboxylesterase